MSRELLPQHSALLAASAIAPAVATARGYRSIQHKARLRELGFSVSQARVPALLIPIWNVAGELATYQIRPDDARIVAGKRVKYELPRGSRMVLDVPPACRPQLGDPAVPLFVTEAPRKADAAASVGLCCVAVIGVWSWRGTNERGGRTALADWESIALNERNVYVVFDSDVATNPSVRAALERLREFLGSRGAHVEVILLPAGPGGVKTGLDDYLAGGHSVDDLLARVTDVPRTVAGGEAGTDDPADGERRSQAQKLVELAADAELFRTPAGEPVATVPVGDHRETHAVRSLAFKGWLRRGYWDAFHQAAGANGLSDAVETLAARAEFGTETHPVSVRIAEHAGLIYVDLANAAWHAVEIGGPEGWRVVDSPPVKFRRPATMEPLPTPVHGGSLDLLRPFVNVASDDAWHLFAGFLIAAFRPWGPYLVLVLYGEQGSAKSTTAKIIRLLIDPGRAPLRGEPREQQDLLIAARNNWIVAFDNVSHLQPWLADALCRLSTGGGLGKRQLYTDQDEVVLDAQRPQVLNGITEFVTRGDLLDRSIIQEQPVLADASRRSEAEFWRAFEAARPRILGALFDAVAAAFANEAHVVLADLPRMADPTRWVSAAEPVLGWRPGTFAASYRRNRREGSALALDAALITGPLQDLAALGEWQSTASELLRRLAELAGNEVSSQREWPKDGKALTDVLKRLAPDLRAMGIDWQRLARSGNARPHVVRRTGGTTVTTVTTVTPITKPDDGTERPAQNRHSGEITVTRVAVRGDGHDGHDGPAPIPSVGLVEPRSREPEAAADEQMTWTG